MLNPYYRPVITIILFRGLNSLFEKLRTGKTYHAGKESAGDFCHSRNP